MTGNHNPKSKHNLDHGLIMHFTLCSFQDIYSPSELVQFLDILACCGGMGHPNITENQTCYWCSQVLVHLAVTRK